MKAQTLFIAAGLAAAAVLPTAAIVANKTRTAPPPNMEIIAPDSTIALSNDAAVARAAAICSRLNERYTMDEAVIFVQIKPATVEDGENIPSWDLICGSGEQI